MINLMLTNSQAGILKRLLMNELDKDDFKEELQEELQEFLGDEKGKEICTKIYTNIEIILEQLEEVPVIDDSKPYGLELGKFVQKDIYNYVSEYDCL